MNRLKKSFNQYKKFYFLGCVVLGFLIGLLATGKLELAFYYALAGAVLFARFNFQFTVQTQEAGMFAASGKFDEVLVVLIAAVVKADNKISKEELDAVQTKLKKSYDIDDYHRLIRRLKVELDAEKVNIDEYAHFAEKWFNSGEKVQMLHFLVKIAVADGVLSNSEEIVLQQITAKIGLPYRTLDSILAMHRFKREEQQQNQSRKTVREDQLANAYKILELQAEATNAQIKKTYKKLAVLHHPDKVAHLSEEIQKSATEKFKIIVAAYDLICKKRGIS